MAAVYEPLFVGELPADVELCERRTGGVMIAYVAINHSRTHTISLVFSEPQLDLISGSSKTIKTLTLEPQGVAVFVVPDQTQLEHTRIERQSATERAARMSSPGVTQR
jgi:hypothetical protein